LPRREIGSRNQSPAERDWRDPAVVVGLGTIGGILIAIGVLGLVLSLAYAASEAPPDKHEEVESRLNELLRGEHALEAPHAKLEGSADADRR